jgi:ribulose-phosphate 3-epimerase
MQQPIRIAPSILAADFANLGEEVRAIEQAGADFAHIDVMDGHFVPNLTIGPEVIRALRPHSDLPFDVHLMISPVDPLLPVFAEAGADILSVHPEAGPHVHRSLQLIKSLGKKAGISLNPGTPVDVDKIAALRRMIDATGRTIDLEVDGGINFETAPKAIAAGADLLVAGTATFTGGPDQYAGNIQRLRGGGQ